MKLVDILKLFEEIYQIIDTDEARASMLVSTLNEEQFNAWMQYMLIRTKQDAVVSALSSYIANGTTH